jgi:hypothetical protein
MNTSLKQNINLSLPYYELLIFLIKFKNRRQNLMRLSRFNAMSVSDGFFCNHNSFAALYTVGWVDFLLFFHFQQAYPCSVLRPFPN